MEDKIILPGEIELPTAKAAYKIFQDSKDKAFLEAIKTLAWRIETGANQGETKALIEVEKFDDQRQLVLKELFERLGYTVELAHRWRDPHASWLKVFWDQPKDHNTLGEWLKGIGQ